MCADWGWGDVGAYGADQPFAIAGTNTRTPTLDGQDCWQCAHCWSYCQVAASDVTTTLQLWQPMVLYLLISTPASLFVHLLGLLS